MEFYFLVTLMCILLGSLNNVQSERTPFDSQNQCEAYCFKALQPLLDHLYVMKNLWLTCDANQLANAASRLDKIEGQLATQAETSTRFSSTIEEVKQKVTEQENLMAKRKKVPHKPFQQIGSKFYYIEQQTPLNWFAAAHKCIALGAHLVELNDQEELNAIIPFLDTQKFYWTDINDLSLEGFYQSLTTGLKAKFLRWNQKEPNSLKGENCIHMLGTEFVMNDLCCEEKCHFICELSDE